MGRPYSEDLRQRVVMAVTEDRLSTAAAAKQFKVSKAAAGVWCRLFKSKGSVSAKPQGAPKRSKLDPHEEFILRLVSEVPDITLDEIVVRLADHAGLVVGRSLVSIFFQKRGITFKKNSACCRTTTTGRPRRPGRLV